MDSDHEALLNDVKNFMEELHDPDKVRAWIAFYEDRLLPTEPSAEFYQGTVTMKTANLAYLAALQHRLVELDPESATGPSRTAQQAESGGAQVPNPDTVDESVAADRARPRAYNDTDNCEFTIEALRRSFADSRYRSPNRRHYWPLHDPDREDIQAATFSGGSQRSDRVECPSEAEGVFQMEDVKEEKD